MDCIPLDGIWLIRRAGNSPRAAEPCALDAGGWSEFRVPGQWQEHPDFADGPESVLFARRFDAGPLAGQAARVELEQVFYRAWVWINGRLLGTDCGWLFPHRHAIPAGLLRETGNTIHVLVHCHRESDPFNKRQILGVFGHWDGALPGAFAGGIAGPVAIRPLPAAELQEFDLCPTWHNSRGWIDVACLITNRAAADSLRLTLRAQCMLRGEPVGEPISADSDHHVPAGDSRHTFRLPIDRPRRWWPWDCGEPHLYDCVLALAADGRELFSASRHVAFRRFEFVNWKYRVNGRRLFLRGTSLTPPQFYLSRVDPRQYVQDLADARELNCNMVRVHGFVADDGFYRRADEVGMIVWQDMPMHWHFGKSVLGEAKRQTALLVRRLRHHPCLGFWNCQNEPFLHGEPRVTKGDRLAELQLMRSVLFSNWNKEVLAASMHAIVRRLAPDVPSMPFSGSFGIFTTGTDSHWYFGTYYGRFRWLPWFRRPVWRGFRLVSEYGSFAFPAVEHLAALAETWQGLAEHEQIPFGLAPWAWSRFLEAAGEGRTSMIRAERVAEFSEPAKLAELAAASHRYQADLLKFYTEYLRIIRYEPASGAISYQLRDSCLMAGMGLIDFLGARRESFDAYRRSNAPAVVLVDFPRRRYAPGGRLHLRVYGINDLPHRLADCRVRVALRVNDSSVDAQEWSADLPPDSRTDLGRFQCGLPADAPPCVGELVTELHRAGTLLAENRYRIYIGTNGPA